MQPQVEGRIKEMHVLIWWERGPFITEEFYFAVSVKLIKID